MSGERSPFERLQLVRRIDWRFLLPSPTIGHAVYAGRRDALLMRALEVFGASFAVLEDDAAEPRGRSDLAVAVDPTRRELRALARALRPGGSVYLELRGLTAPSYRRGALPLRAVERGLRELGLEDVRRHWHFPDAGSCEEIVPLGDARTVRYSLARRRSAPLARAKAAAARLALSVGVLPAIVPARSVTARLPEDRR